MASLSQLELPLDADTALGPVSASSGRTTVGDSAESGSALPVQVMPATDVPLPTPPALPEQPRARSTDPDTSKAAARSVGALTVKRLAVLRVFELFGPLTDEQLQARYAATGAPGQSPSGIRTRRHELVEQGALVDTGERGRTVSGRAAIVWGLPTGGQDGTPSDTPEGANAGLQTVAKGVL